MARKKKHEEHENHERWLVSYADFITLLFAFFVVMWSSSQVDAEKLKQVALALGASFGNGRGKVASLDDGKFSGGTYIDEDAARFAPLITSLVRDYDGDAAGYDELVALANARASLLETLEAERGAEPIRLTLDERGVALHIPADEIFREGQTAIAPRARALLRRIGGIVRAVPNPFIVEATVAVPTTDEMDEALRIEGDRATALARFFLDEFHFDPDRVLVSAFATASSADRLELGEGSTLRIIVLAQPEGS